MNLRTATTRLLRQLAAPHRPAVLHFLRNPVPGEVVNKITDSLAFPMVNGFSRAHPGEGRSEAVVTGWGSLGIPRKGAGWAEQHRAGMTVP